MHPGENGNRAPYAVILGTNEIASAVAVRLHKRGYGVTMSHDPLPPVIRRKMAFHDALFDDPVTLAGVAAERIDSGADLPAFLSARTAVAITELGLLDLIVVRKLDLLIDARMQKHQMRPDLRHLADFTIGLGPGFHVDRNCDFAIETMPGKAGTILRHGSTEPADGTFRLLADRGGERFVYSTMPGRWHTAIDIGSRVFRNYIVGYLGNTPIQAPFDGILRGVVRDGTEAPAGVKLLEVDPRMRGAVWTGIDDRAHGIAIAVEQALDLRRETCVAVINSRKSAMPGP
ncbi:xanthine dehydrogenase [Niveispirillum sp. SYP-B3756]|nr:xanthine dehydrogenase [Niveispirillum sp. SYP-B3756]